MISGSTAVNGCHENDSLNSFSLHTMLIESEFVLWFIVTFLSDVWTLIQIRSDEERNLLDCLRLCQFSFLGELLL